ncbi:protein kinase domain-containing protein [Subtercola lobariae]|uniref:non-specific serine/threonine protein kinase n=1 Tax=Subtercola lobariae TaxID=1588641 RepID=A0A917EYI1_9MICO|nr:serine/threonine-protein kinase [Subtercola lobariae]GGF22851.1 serine/threonine protein kinase [Subtercola lobariae]
MAPDNSGVVGQSLAHRYTVTARIGSGGMSTVYEALDTQLGRRVAIKIFNPGEARDDDRRRGEVDVLARLNHPNLVTMYDAHLTSGDTATPSFVVMELVNGPDLRSTLDHGPLRGSIAAQVAADIAQALAAMHAQGIVHRDLKPANILLAPTGLPSPRYRAKLTDFGIAHLVGTDRMTTVGTIIGTASYLSPEQAEGAPPGPAADVYALGLVILESLTGHREYPGTVVEALSARASRDPVVSDELPIRWASLITHMTARSPESRPSALEVAERSREITADLAAWDGSPVSPDTGEATAAMLTPTRRLPLAEQTLTDETLTDEAPTTQTVIAETVIDRHPRRGLRPALLICTAIVVLAGAVWAGVALLPGQLMSDSTRPAPVVTTSSDSSSAPIDQGTTTQVEPVATSEPTAEPTTSTPSSVQPTATTAPSSAAPSPTDSGNGNNGSGNGKGNGNGNGNGNGKGNGNGNGKG